MDPLHSCIEIKLEKPDSKVDGLEYNCDSFDLDVSEDFINTILKHVDNLCDIIRNGDPSRERTTEVNENLNSAVSCYRSRLISIDSKHQGNLLVKGYCQMVGCSCFLGMLYEPNQQFL